MQKVAHFIANGWQSKLKSVPPDVEVYFPIRDELIVVNEVILKGLRVAVPNSLRKYIQLLHKGHPGADATRRRAKDIVYWPSMMPEMDSSIALCQPCNRATPAERTASRPPISGDSVVPFSVLTYMIGNQRNA